MYQVFLSDEAQNQLAAIDKRYQRAITSALKRLEENPELGKPLGYDLKGKLRLRVSRYRIVYNIDHKAKIVTVLIIEHRKDVYR